MEELITKYLTDELSESEMKFFRILLANDAKFRKEFMLSLAALSIADYSFENTLLCSSDT